MLVLSLRISRKPGESFAFSALKKEVIFVSATCWPAGMRNLDAGLCAGKAPGRTRWLGMAAGHRDDLASREKSNLVSLPVFQPAQLVTCGVVLLLYK